MDFYLSWWIAICPIFPSMEHNELLHIVSQGNSSPSPSINKIKLRIKTGEVPGRASLVNGCLGQPSGHVNPNWDQQWPRQTMSKQIKISFGLFLFFWLWKFASIVGFGIHSLNRMTSMHGIKTLGQISQFN